jgi:hypothetical protein
MIAVRREAAILSRGVEDYFDAAMQTSSHPAELLHFTDTAGLIGILQSRTLWASLATALNDASETNVAMRALTSYGSNDIVESRHMDAGFLDGIARGVHVMPNDDRANDYRSYVASLCAKDAAVHWLHYGRGGTGVALVLDANELAKIPQFKLVKVRYDPDDQSQFLRGLVDLVDAFLDGCIAAVSDEIAFTLKLFAGDLLVRYTKLIAAHMKDVAFSAEDEWRLVSSETWERTQTPSQKARDTHFRSAGARVVPYKEVPMSAESIKAIQLGASSPLRPDEQALRVLMDECLKKQVPVTRSRVAVRP